MTRRLHSCLGLLLGLAALYTLLGAWGTWRVDWEFERLRDKGWLAERAAPEPAELLAARRELHALLSWEAEYMHTATGEIFSAGTVPDLYTEAEIREQLQSRAHFFEGLERLPAELWERPGTRAGSPGIAAVSSPPRLFTIQAASWALGVQAWSAGRDPGGGAAAGRICARALAIARVQDNGTSISLMIRMGALANVEKVLVQLLDEGLVETGELLGPVQHELDLLFDDEHLKRSLITDLVLLQDWERQQPWSLAAWLHRPRTMRERLGYARAFRQLMLGTPGAVLPGEDAQLPEHLIFCPLSCDEGGGYPWWWGVGETFRSSRARVAPLRLAG